MGITTTPPEQVEWNLEHEDVWDDDYAVLHEPSWVSSDAGTLWLNGQGDSPYTNSYPQYEHWRDKRPKDLVVDDVVRFLFIVEVPLKCTSTTVSKPFGMYLYRVTNHCLQLLACDSAAMP